VIEKTGGVGIAELSIVKAFVKPLEENKNYVVN